MSESVLKSILEESARLEWAKYENAQEHVFSKKHERKMKHVFKLFERNDCKLKPYIGSRPHYHFRFTKRNIIVLLAVYKVLRRNTGGNKTFNNVMQGLSDAIGA